MILTFDTCQSACSVALGTAQGALIAHKWEAMGRGQAERLLPMIEEMLAEAKVSKSDLTRVLVTTGPGTFAGQRVGIAAARGLGLALGVDVIGLTVTELMAAAWAAHTNGPDTLMVIFDARRNEAYVQNFTRGGDKALPLDVVRLINLDTLADHTPAAPFALAGTGQDFVPQGQATDLLLPDAQFALRLASDLEAGPDRLPRPLYLRAPDADLPRNRPRQRSENPSG